MRYLFIFIIFLFSFGCSNKFYLFEKIDKSIPGSYYVIKKDTINQGNYSIIKDSLFFGNSIEKKRIRFGTNRNSVMIYPVNKNNGYIIRYIKGEKSIITVRDGRRDLLSPSW